MKKLKYLPAMLMLVLCVGILAIGIYAIQPSKNTISGTITVNASSAEIGIQVYHTAVHADNLIKEYESVRSGVDIPLTHEALDYTMENINSLDQVNETPKKVIIKITNKSGKDLGGYFFNPDSTLVDGKATKANIDTDVTLDGKGEDANGAEVTETGLLKATFSGYTQIPAKDPTDETKNGSAEIEISFELLKFVSYDMDIDLSEFNIQLNVEEYNFILNSKQKFIVSSGTTTPFEVELVQDQAQVATLSSTGAEQTLALDALIFGENMPEKSVYSIKVTNKSEDQSLGVYFHTGDLPTEDGTAEKGTEGVKAGYASAENIVLEGAIYNKDNLTEKLADVTLDPYSYIAVQDNETGANKDFDEIEMEMIVTLTDKYSTGKIGEFSFELRIEPYVYNMAKSSMSVGTGSYSDGILTGTNFSGALLKLDDTSSYNIPYAAFYGNDSINHLVLPDKVGFEQGDWINWNGIRGTFASSSIISASIRYGRGYNDSCFTDIFSDSDITYVKITYGGVGSMSFSGCTKLKFVNLGNISTIGAGAFLGCTSLTTIYIPSSVTSIATATDYQDTIGGPFIHCNSALIINCGANSSYGDVWGETFTVNYNVDRFGNSLS